MTNIHVKAKENLTMLAPYFSRTNTLDEDAQIIGQFIESLLPVRSVALLRASNQETAVWSSFLSPRERSGWQQSILGCAEELLALVRTLDTVEGAPLLKLLSPLRSLPLLALPIYYDGEVYALLLVQRGGGAWVSTERDILRMLCGLIGLPFAAMHNLETAKLSNFVFNTVLDDMQTSLYVTDPQTDRILFMNQTMKDVFGLKDPEGQVCWQVLQRGMEGRCAFCPVDKLMDSQMENPAMQWEEISTVTGRSYQNYDSLIRWVDGSTVHLQQSIDVTELKSANIDELTHMLTRRSGKIAMTSTLEAARKQNVVFTICLYDINNLKIVNDQHGHAEGDRMLRAISDTVRGVLHPNEYALRLSGDEFVVVFDCSRKVAEERMKRVLASLRTVRAAYDVSFCYGLVEIQPQMPLSLDEILFLADERMYQQKRHYHIRSNESLLSLARAQEDEDSMDAEPSVFTYNKELLYDALVKSTDDYLYVCNMKTGVFRYSHSMVEEFDLPGEVVPNAAAVWGAKVHPDDRAAFLEANQEINDARTLFHCVEYRAQNRSGQWVWLRCRGHLELDASGEPALFAGFISNLGKRNKIDALTGLYNRVAFQEHIETLMSAHPDAEISIMMLGIDDLKHINDLYDRAFGDEVIRIVAQKLRSLLSANAALYRLDGDEYGIISLGANRTTMQRLYSSIQHSFRNQQQHAGKKYYCTLSAGCVLYPENGNDYRTLIRHLSYALESAKSKGKKQCVFFAPEILRYRAHTLELMEALRESIDNDFAGFSLVFQPLVRSSTGLLTSVEALARWRNDRFGAVPPNEFIPLLEESGMIIPVGQWVLHTAMWVCKKWLEEIPELVLNVNLSYLQVQGLDFLKFLKQTIADCGFPPKNLVLELTESYFATEYQRVQHIIEEIRAMGIRIAMDDFGTGYSTLSSLKQSPADIVKIDKTFVRDIQNSHFDATFIRFIVELCHDVDIEVCLEGVETEDEYRLVSSMGLDMIQGFLFDRPMTPQEFGHKHLPEEQEDTVKS